VAKAIFFLSIKSTRYDEVVSLVATHQSSGVNRRHIKKNQLFARKL
jgi:hypothetical protein